MNQTHCDSCPLEPGEWCLLADRGQCRQAQAEARRQGRTGQVGYWRSQALARVRPDFDGPEALIVYVHIAGGQALENNFGHSARILNRMGHQIEGMDYPGHAHVRSILDRIGSRTRTVFVHGVLAEPSVYIDFARQRPWTRFVARCHSNLAFLTIEPMQFRNLRGIANAGLSNLIASSVGEPMARSFTALYGPCAWLGNLYDLESAQPRIERPADAPLEIGIFGALRYQKHHPTSVAAAMLVGRKLDRAVRIHVNIGKQHIQDQRIVEMIRSMTTDVPGVELVVRGWLEPAEFRTAVAQMDLCFQLSSSESFNYVTADATAAGVPTVIGEAITWMPVDFVAPIDDENQAAEVGLRLLADPTAGSRARAALEAHNARVLPVWESFLGERPQPRLDEARPVQRPTAPAETEHARAARECPHAEPILIGGKPTLDRFCTYHQRVVCLLSTCLICAIPQASH